MTELLQPEKLVKIHHFFDYLWNLDGGLINVQSIIKSRFVGFEQLQNYVYRRHPQWNTSQDLRPIVLACANVNADQLVHCDYPNIAFVHHKRSTDLMESMIRKAERFLAILDDDLPLTFIYYRQYHAPINGNYINQLDYDISDKLSHFVQESRSFVDAFIQLYPTKEFKLFSLFMEPIQHMPGVTDKISDFISQLTNTEHLVYERVFRRGGAKSRSKWRNLLEYIHCCKKK